jgi:hypothetical protein
MDGSFAVIRLRVHAFVIVGPIFLSLDIAELTVIGHARVGSIFVSLNIVGPIVSGHTDVGFKSAQVFSTTDTHKSLKLGLEESGQLEDL